MTGRQVAMSGAIWLFAASQRVDPSGHKLMTILLKLRLVSYQLQHPLVLKTSTEPAPETLLLKP